MTRPDIIDRFFKPTTAATAPLSSILAALALSVLLTSCTQPATPGEPLSTGLGLQSTAPDDIKGGAQQADMQQAAEFAWQQFFAMTWPATAQNAELNTRGVPASRVLPDDLSSPRTWETMRAKTEVFPGIGDAHGSDAGEKSDYGFDQAPVYRYDPESVGSYPDLEPGLVPACYARQQKNNPPWIELSEAHEVGPEQMYAGHLSRLPGSSSDHDQRVLYSVKADRSFYRYVVAKSWYNGGNEGSVIPATDTENYIALKHASPPPDGTELVGFPNESKQIKTAWRKLTRAEKRAGEFITTWARSYQLQDPNKSYAGQPGNLQYPCYIDGQWGLVGMHIKTRTATAPYYIWATFEHSDNIRNDQGRPVEDADGRLIANQDKAATEPAITVKNAIAANPQTPDSIQKMSPDISHADPGRRLYYINLAGTPTTQGKIAVNRRIRDIPDPVIEVNHAAHQAIREFLHGSRNHTRSFATALSYYKLVGVQWQPADKPSPGQDVESNPAETNPVLAYPANYYLANIMLETSYRLQNYSGKVQRSLPAPNENLDTQDLVTDFDARGIPVKNVMYDGQKPDGVTAGFNMGGCMGCHGQIQLKGYDFSFIFRRGRINAPEVSQSRRLPLMHMVHPPQTRNGE